MKKLLIPIIAVAMLGIVSQADVILDFDGNTVGDVTRAGTGDGLIEDTPGGTTFFSERVGELLTIPTDPNTTYTVEIFTDPTPRDKHFTFRTDGANDLDWVLDVPHVTKVSSTTMKFLGHPVSFYVPEICIADCPKTIGHRRIDACSGGLGKLLVGTQRVNWFSKPCGMPAANRILTYEVLPDGGVAPQVISAIGGTIQDPVVIILGPAPTQLPKGDKGDPGPQGDPGSQGVQGKIGPAGDTGAAAPCVDCSVLTDAVIDFTCKILAANPPTILTAFDDYVDAIVDALTLTTNVCAPSDHATCIADIKTAIDALK
jgi:hypothetical protein